ncbi:hypothetical protein HK100_005021 [Physocladia obscura]|uniref:Peptidase M20 dimerisation domain-containing protein n=1 Tax=Physocladia obscura TaxID=109957 RepID=A0AAD5SUM5_9FUNG|nr:hypothetical protein HK100_005021 [Physocladia obscura]
MENTGLLTATPSISWRQRARRFARTRIGAIIVASIAVVSAVLLLRALLLPNQQPQPPLIRCAQTPALVPSTHAEWISKFSGDNTYIAAAAERLAGAVRIRTESFDEWRGVAPPSAPTPDSVHAGFEQLHTYLVEAFPLVHATLTRRVINRYALLYTWTGSESISRKEYPAPLLLMAHQDTVPVLNASLPLWSEPPFSGKVDLANDAIWGRGAVDTKPTLVGALEAIEALLHNKFIPKMDVYLAFGYDEEISGYQGAKPIAEFLENSLGLKGKFGLILDEGLDSITETDGINLAIVNTAEKGYLDYHISLETPGGHSSVPPLHTGIGLMSQLINALENNPYPIKLTESNPYFGTIVCSAEHSPNPDKYIKNALSDFNHQSENLANYLAARSLKDRYRMASSQAIDIIQGGLKVNALPELVTVDINNRISIDSSASEFQIHTANSLLPIAKKYNLNFTFIDFLHPNSGKPLASHRSPTALGNVTVFTRASDFPLEPSPISIVNTPAWNIVEGTIHHVYERPESWLDAKPRQFVVAPGLMAGNTDTRHFWNLSKNILRFAPAVGGFGYHTVDERASIKGYMTAVTFFHELIRNYDEQIGEKK